MTTMKKTKPMRWAMPNAPTAMSPPYLTSVVFMNITMMHEQAFIENGEMPMAIMFFTMSLWSL